MSRGAVSAKQDARLLDIHEARPFMQHDYDTVSVRVSGQARLPQARLVVQDGVEGVVQEYGRGSRASTPLPMTAASPAGDAAGAQQHRHELH